MQNPPSLPPKPVAKVWRPELTRLPEYTLWRRLVRAALWVAAQVLVKARTRLTVSGLENFPKRGPGLIVFNHLGDADAILLAASIPTTIDGMGKIELIDDWRASSILRAYGIIWVHRGRPDRRALRAALDGLAEGRMILLSSRCSMI